MTKPLTVETVLKNLIDQSKPRPLEVIEHEPKLKGGTEVIRFWLAVAIIFQLRTAVVWGFLALFFPQFGVTWFMVMFGLWAVRHAKPVNIKQVIKAIAAQRR